MLYPRRSELFSHCWWETQIHEPNNLIPNDNWITRAERNGCPRTTETHYVPKRDSPWSAASSSETRVLQLRAECYAGAGREGFVGLGPVLPAHAGFTRPTPTLREREAGRTLANCRVSYLFKKTRLPTTSLISRHSAVAHNKKVITINNINLALSSIHSLFVYSVPLVFLSLSSFRLHCDISRMLSSDNVRWITCHRGTARPQLADGGDGLQILRATANILHKQSRTADKGWSSS
jgi:hypothetical protein